VHLLHPTSDGDTGRQDGVSAAAAGTSAPKSDATLQQQQQQQGQQQQQQSPVSALLKELLGIAITSRSEEAVDLLCKVPSTSSLGEFRVAFVLLTQRMCLT
jgi:hypothetical protein